MQVNTERKLVWPTKKSDLVLKPYKAIHGEISFSVSGHTRADRGWGYLIRSVIDNYQSWFVLLIIVLATAAAVLVGEFLSLSTFNIIRRTPWSSIFGEYCLILSL